MNSTWKADAWIALHVHWDRQVDAVRDAFAQLGDEQALAEFESDLAASQRLASDVGASNVVDGMLRIQTEAMTAALTDLGTAPNRFIAVRVTPTYWNSISATYRDFDDGSVGIAIANALITLTNSYAAFASVPMADIAGSTPWRGLMKTRQATRRGSLLASPGPLSGFLRYTVIHQRVFGLSAKLDLRLDEEATRIAVLIATFALRFVLGHELAHHALEHQGGHHGISTEGAGSARARQQEADADMLAFQALTRSIEHEFADVPLVRSTARPLAVLGVLTALVAVYADEQAILLRQGNSHPRVTERVQLVLDQLQQHEREFAAIFASALVSATDMAADFSPAVGTWHWPSLQAANPDITALQPLSYLRDLEHWDRMQCLTPAHQSEFFTGPKSDPRAREGFHLLQTGHVTDALQQWGVPERDAGLIGDRTGSFAFGNLVAALRGGFARIGVPKVGHRATAVVGASVAAPFLRAVD